MTICSAADIINNRHALEEIRRTRQHSKVVAAGWERGLRAIIHL
jgi:hypothetical protein